MKMLTAGYAALYNFSYMAIGALLPLVGQYLTSIGFSGTQIGTVTAAGTTVAIAASAFWGRAYNRSGKKHEILTLLCTMAALVCIFLMNARDYGTFLVLFGILYFFQAPIMSLTDAFTVTTRSRFGGLRAWGALGFALGIFLAGNASELLGLEVIFFFYIISFALAAAMILLIRYGQTAFGHMQKGPGPTTPSNPAGGRAQAAEKRPAGYKDILKDKWIRRLIFCAFFMGGTNVANNTYFSFLYIEGGGTVAGVGVCMLLMVGSEVPFMAWCEGLSRRFTMERVILAAMTISVGRFLLFGLGPPWWMLMLLSFSQGAVNGILLIEFVRYVSRLAPSGNESISISVYYIIGSNLSAICCQTIGGAVLDLAGAQGVYFFFGIFNLIGVCLYVKWGFQRGAANRR